MCLEGAETRSKTAKSGYLVRPRGTFYPGERDAAQSVGNWFDQVEGVDVTQRFNPETQTIRGATYGTPGMFDQPVTQTSMPAPDTPVEPAAPSSPADFSPETQDALSKAGFKIDFSKLSAQVGVGTLAGVGAYAALMDPAQAAVDVGLEVGARALGAAAGPAAAVPMMMAPTELGDATMRPEDRMAAIATQDSAMKLKPEARQDFIPTPEVEDDNFLTMQP